MQSYPSSKCWHLCPLTRHNVLSVGATPFPHNILYGSSCGACVRNDVRSSCLYVLSWLQSSPLVMPQTFMSQLGCSHFIYKVKFDFVVSSMWPPSSDQSQPTVNHSFLVCFWSVPYVLLYNLYITTVADVQRYSHPPHKTSPKASHIPYST